MEPPRPAGCGPPARAPARGPPARRGGLEAVVHRLDVLLLLALAAPSHCCDPENVLIDHPCVNCVPAGATMFYSTTYNVPDFAPLYVGSSSGYDASDPRYRWNNEPYGNWATPLYTHPNHSEATLFLGSAHIATLDPNYLACMNVKAMVNVAAKNWHHMDMMPYWRDITETGGPWRPYPNVSVNSVGIIDLRMTEMQWVEYWWSIEEWIDKYLDAGVGVYIHDHKGCRGAAAAAIYYIMKKQGTVWKDTYEQVMAKRPCVSALRVREWPNKWHLAKLKELSPDAPTTVTRTTTATTATETSTEVNYTVEASDDSASSEDTSDNSTATATSTTTTLVYSR